MTDTLSIKVRLPVSLRAEAEAAARNAGISLNFFMVKAIEERAARVELFLGEREAIDQSEQDGSN